jgi:fructose-1,6-bisphosphatase/inositol monophosphatase family enzyme
LRSERAWLVDPLDGTANFIAGSADWAVMVALLVNGDAALAWIWQPVAGRMYVAERGSGASCNGAALKVESTDRADGKLRGAVLTKFLPPAIADSVRRNSSRFGAISKGRYCAGVEYPAVIAGEQDFALFWRTLPWDHVPGALLLQEAGGVARRPDGAPFLPFGEGDGLLIASGESAWSSARRLLD